jgi:hypothetical protein
MIQQYKNLRIWLAIIIVISFAISQLYYDFPLWSMMDMQILMGVWFLIFGVMKLPDIRWFAILFRQYDPLAKYVSWYALIYPFIEIGLWILYLRYMQMKYSLPMNTLTALITGITSLGIIYTLYQGSKIKCACMWNKMTTPLWRPSLIEQIWMCIMALWMIGMML